MRVAVEALASSQEPRLRLYPEQRLAMLLEPGSIEMGWRRSELTRFAYGAGEIILSRRHGETWARSDGVRYLSIGISDAALRAASNGMSGAIELRSAPKLEDARVTALVAAVNAERLAGFPSGRLFLTSVEQALAVALVNNHAVRHSSAQAYRGGMSPARLRRVTELVQARIENEISLAEMAETAGLSSSYFSQMFRMSTGESPHQFVLRIRVERAKEMLRAPKARVLDVAIACGFKTQQHFARVFRRACGATPTEYRREFVYHEATLALEIYPDDTQSFPGIPPTQNRRRSIRRMCEWR